MKRATLRAIPAVERILQTIGEAGMPRPVVAAVGRRELTMLRKKKQSPGFDEIVARIGRALDTLRSGRIQPVINGTGILIHTNLGRAPLGLAVVETLGTIASHYNNLEYDLRGGERGSRA